MVAFLLGRNAISGQNDDLRLHQILLKRLINALEHLTALCVIGEQVVVLFDDVGNFSGRQAVREDLCLGFNLLHQFRVLMNDFSDLTLQVSPNFLLILNDVLSFV